MRPVRAPTASPSRSLAARGCRGAPPPGVWGCPPTSLVLKFRRVWGESLHAPTGSAQGRRPLLAPRQPEAAQGNDILLNLRRAARVLRAAIQVQPLDLATQPRPRRATRQLAVQAQQV